MRIDVSAKKTRFHKDQSCFWFPINAVAQMNACNTWVKSYQVYKKNIQLHFKESKLVVRPCQQSDIMNNVNNGKWWMEYQKETNRHMYTADMEIISHYYREVQNLQRDFLRHQQLTFDGYSPEKMQPKLYTSDLLLLSALQEESEPSKWNINSISYNKNLGTDAKCSICSRWVTRSYKIIVSTYQMGL